MINFLYSILMIALCLILGKIIDAMLGGLPGSLYGMLIFTSLLHYRIIKSHRISATIAWLIQHMGVCFVPAGVGIINHFDLIKSHGFTLISIIFVTTFLIITFVGLLYQRSLDKHQLSDDLTIDDLTSGELSTDVLTNDDLSNERLPTDV